MENNNDFSGIPALGDVQGLENFLTNQNLAAQGLPTQPAQPTQPAAQPAAPANPAPAATPAQPATPAAQPAAPSLNPGNVTREDIAAILQKLDAINSGRAAQPAPQAQPRPATQPAAPQFTYTDQERNFVINAMQQGYSLSQINQVIMQRRTQNGYAPQNNTAIEQRMNNLEQYLRSQEYKQAETVFVDRLTTFGNKFGLSEQDLVTFGNAALQKGINIAVPNVDLETVFRAVYPEQYAIRVQRMTPTNTSQIYGGTSIPEGNRASAAKAEDAYVDAFLRQTMPNQYGMLNKK